MLRTVQRMFVELRIAVGDNIDVSAFNADYEMGKLDDGQDAVCDELLENDVLMLANTFDLTLDGSFRYYIPDSIPFDYENILMVEDITSGATSPQKTVVTAWNERMYSFFNVGEFSSGTVKWSLIDNYIEFPEQPSTGTMRIWYTRRPAGMFFGTVGAGNTSTTVVFGVTPTMGEILAKDDYINGMKVYFDGQVSRITGFVYSTLTATITPAWSTTPIDSTSTYEVISPLPERYLSRVVNEAARLIKIHLDDDDTLLARKNQEDSTHMNRRMSNRQQQAPEMIGHVPR